MEMKELVARLYAFKISAKLVHWKLKGSNFLFLHEYMDEVAEPIDDFIDGLLEKYFMATEDQELIDVEKVFKDESIKYYVTDFSDNNTMIKEIMNKAIEIQDMIEDFDTYRGVNVVLDEISVHMLKTIALIKAQLK